MAQRRRVWIGLAAITLLACGSDAHGIRVVTDPVDLADSLERVELTLVESCEGVGFGALPPGDREVLDLRRGEPSAKLGTVERGRFGLWGRGWNGACEVVAAGCSPVNVNGSGDALEVVLRPMEGAGCGLSERCEAFACVPSNERLSAGDGHTCASGLDGRLWCWGANGAGQLGPAATEVMHALPVEVSLPAPPVSLALGDGHTCAATSEGDVYCWGANALGQLGVTMAEASVAAPQRVLGVGKVSEVAAGDAHTCAVGDGGMFCWGDNAQGQLGVDAPAMSAVPIRPPWQDELDGALVGISLGRVHSCALSAEGTAYCWGSNTIDQVGGGSPGGGPSPVAARNEVAAVEAGWQHTCALTTGGSAVCWGRLVEAQRCGAVAPPPEEAFPATLLAIAAGVDHTCVLREDRTVACCGENGGGQVGDGTTQRRESPTATSGLVDARLIAAGHDHSCALLEDGLRCWGENDAGQLGDGTTNDGLEPVAVDLPMP